MKPQLTIGIITAGRPHAVRECLASIQENVLLDHNIIVVDSTISDESLRLYENTPNTQCLAFDSPISPSAARKLIAENVNTPYLLFLDDDIQVTPGSVSTMLEYLKAHPDVDIVSAAWLENGRFRELGQRFNFGVLGDKRVVYKTFVTIDEVVGLGLTSIQVDGVQATMLLRSHVFDKVQFDPQYGFAFELFDFYLQCYQQELRIHALPGVIFEHRPSHYISPTLKQTSDRENDRQKFAQKWGIYPVGPLGYLESKASQTPIQRTISLIRRGASLMRKKVL